MSNNHKALIRDLRDQFGFTQISGNEESLDRWIIVADINRPGLELAGFFDHTEPKRVVIIGIKESAYINQMSPEEQRERFDAITDGWTPTIIISTNLPCPPILLEIAQYKNFPLFASTRPTSELMIEVIAFLDEQLAPVDSVHGVLVNCYGTGVLITGESGVGKSEIALELVRRGHVLISDDRVEVKRIHNQLIGYAPELIAGMLEVRGIGVIDVAQMFGASAVLEESDVDFVISLEDWDVRKEYLRVGIEDEQNFELHGIEIPMITFPVRQGRNMAMLIESAILDYRLKVRGFDSSKRFVDKVYNHIQKKNEKIKAAKGE
ncbi:MAG TPA: HPr(Ser) kinase/phosphatase [Erysipelothrix sp.]|nr:HPr(Ser) kinase/phosphatase [Erysipelothrix sp.]